MGVIDRLVRMEGPSGSPESLKELRNQAQKKANQESKKAETVRQVI